MRERFFMLKMLEIDLFEVYNYYIKQFGVHLWI